MPAAAELPRWASLLLAWEGALLAGAFLGGLGWVTAGAFLMERADERSRCGWAGRAGVPWRLGASRAVTPPGPQPRQPGGLLRTAPGALRRGRDGPAGEGCPWWLAGHSQLSASDSARALRTAPTQPLAATACTPPPQDTHARYRSYGLALASRLERSAAAAAQGRERLQAAVRALEAELGLLRPCADVRGPWAYVAGLTSAWRRQQAMWRLQAGQRELQDLRATAEAAQAVAQRHGALASSLAAKASSEGGRAAGQLG